MSLPFQIIPIDLEKSLHANFVFGSVLYASRFWPYTREDVQWLLDQVKRTYAANRAGCVMAVADDDHELPFGFVITLPGEVVHAYTKPVLRGPGYYGRPHTPSRHGVCSSLLASAGVDLATPTQVRIWSESASKIAARGYNVYPTVVR